MVIKSNAPLGEKQGGPFPLAKFALRSFMNLFFKPTEDLLANESNNKCHNLHHKQTLYTATVSRVDERLCALRRVAAQSGEKGNCACPGKEFIFIAAKW